MKRRLIFAAVAGIIGFAAGSWIDSGIAKRMDFFKYALGGIFAVAGLVCTDRKNVHVTIANEEKKAP